MKIKEQDAELTLFNSYPTWVAVIAPWFCLCLPSCGPRFESQAHHLCFFNLYWNCNEKRTKINKKEAWIVPFLNSYHTKVRCMQLSTFLKTISEALLRNIKSGYHVVEHGLFDRPGVGPASDEQQRGRVDGDHAVSVNSPRQNQIFFPILWAQTGKRHQVRIEKSPKLNRQNIPVSPTSR